jgi:hypothetical protein
MPDELTEELIRLRETDRDTKRQLGELAKVTGIQTKKSGVIKLIVKRVVINTKSVAGETLIWGNSTFGIWGTNKWGSTAKSSFILGHPQAAILGTSPLGSQPSDWETYYDSGDLV